MMLAAKDRESAGQVVPSDRETDRARPAGSGRAAGGRDSSSASSAAPFGMRDALSEAIRSVILPRLVAARRARDIGLAHEGDRITEHDVAAMLADVLTPDQSVADAMLTLLKLRGVSRDDVLAGLFPAVERRLRRLRADSRCTPAEMKLALGRLERLMRSKALPPAPQPTAEGCGRILVVGALDERSALAALILDDLLRSAGLETVNASGIAFRGPAHPDAMIVARSIDVVAIVVPQDMAPDALADAASRLRRSFAGPLVAVAAEASPTDPAADAVGLFLWSDLRNAAVTVRGLIAKAERPGA